MSSEFSVPLKAPNELALKELSFLFLRQAKGHCKFSILNLPSNSFVIINSDLNKLNFKNLDKPTYVYLPLKSHFLSSYFRLELPPEDANSVTPEHVLINLKENWVIARQKKNLVDVCSYLHIVPLPLA